MSIYIPITLTEHLIKSFVPCRLYIKELAGVKYFGKTVAKDPEKYTGSGVIWKNRIKKYGRKNIRTLWVSEIYTDPFEIMAVALHFSKENDIVNSANWANLKPEYGIDGGSPKGTNKGRKHTVATCTKISDAKKGKSINRTTSMSEEAKLHLSKLNTGKSRSAESIEKQKATVIAQGGYTHTEETLIKMRKPKSEVAIQNMKSAVNPRSKGGHWINNGHETKFTKGAIPNGWVLGILNKPVPPSQKGKFWITNGIKCKMSYTIPEGWRKGRK